MENKTKFQEKCSNSYNKVMMEDSTSIENAAFIDCDCYDSLLKSGSVTSKQCAITEGQWYIKDSKSYVDICIVSLDQAKMIDLTRPLPNPLLLQQDLTQEADNWNIFPLVTMFDTSCEADANRDGALPLFPGYGKFANTCPNKGFIKLNGKNNLSLPTAIEYYSGTPPPEMFWFEFMDGTSTSFLSNSLHTEQFFDPSFASCGCSDCPSNQPGQSKQSETATPSPSQIPIEVPSRSPQPEKPTAKPSQQLTTKDCPSSAYESCNLFATRNCVKRTNKSESCRFDAAADAMKRRMIALEEVIESLEVDEKNVSRNETLVFDGNVITRKWIFKEMQYHSNHSASLKHKINTRL